MNIKKGQKIWVIDNTRRIEIRETTVKSVGPKYITTDYDSRLKFYADTLREVDGYGYSSLLVLDIEEYKIKKHYNDIMSKLKRFDWDIDRDKLDEIAKLLNLADK